MVKRADTDTWIQATVEMTLNPGDTIKTGGHSKTQITFFEGSTIELEVSTEITVAELGISETGSTKIHLTQTLGKTISRVQKLTDSASSFDIETPAAIAAVRGSTMIVIVTSSGRTVVANEHGDIRVIVADIEYPVSEGMQRFIGPGEMPSAEIPIIPVGGYTPPPQARLDVTMQAAPAEVHLGEVITYTYTLQNTGDLSFSNISASNDVSGNATYQGGDLNSNGLLDPNEKWVLTSTYTVSSEDYPQVVATGNISATTSTGVTVTSTETATTLVSPVLITSPEDGTTVNIGTIEVSGIIIDPAFSEGTITVNGGEPGLIEVSEGSFFGTGTLTGGDNTITVTVTDGEGHTSSDTIAVYLAPYAIRIELTWSTDNNTDLDAHFIRPGSVFNDPVGDCYYNLSNRNPDWGILGVVEDNPSLDQDDFAGYGPEIITLLQPYEQGIYQFKVHYNTYPGSGTDPTVATVQIWINEGEPVVFTKEMVADEVWDCAIIEWPSGMVSQVLQQ
jgi:uncharacterized repeat protein (TIGR01451 family)